MSDVLRELAIVLEERKTAASEESYVASLHKKGLNKILEKIGEEATETIIAAKECDASPESRAALVNETADLWFHSLVMLSHLDLGPEEVLEELQKRFNISGHVEKASRTN